MTRIAGKGPLQGGIILGGPQEIPPSQHIHILHGFEIRVGTVSGADDLVVGYKMIILDARENTSYQMTFGQQEKDTLKEMFDTIPNVGQSISQEPPSNVRSLTDDV